VASVLIPVFISASYSLAIQIQACGLYLVFDDKDDITMNSIEITFATTTVRFWSISSHFASKSDLSSWLLRIRSPFNQFKGLLYGWGTQLNNEVHASVNAQLSNDYQQ
jgi:hypothetical protein